MKHTKSYRGLENGAGQIVCSCGFETPAVDDSSAFTLGRKQRSVESYFEEHLALASYFAAQKMDVMDEQGPEPGSRIVSGSCIFLLFSFVAVVRISML